MVYERVSINEQKVRKDGTVAVYALVEIENRLIRINTGVTVKPERFDKIKGRIKGTSPAVKDDNLIIGYCLSRINEIQIKYRLQYRTLTAKLFLKEYKNPSMKIDFYDFMDKKIIERVKNKEIEEVSAKHHRVLLNRLKEFKKSLIFAEIDLKFIFAFRDWLRISKNYNDNTLRKILGYFKAYLNIAKCQEIIKVNPFDKFKIKRVEAHRTYLTDTELKKLFALYKAETLPDHLQRTLRYFLFMCYTGLRISDFIRLKKDNVQENALCFIPHKTSSQKQKIVYVPLITIAKELIQDENSESDFVFQPINEQKMNYQLKDILAELKIKRKITNHSARHTFATLFIEKTSSVATLQKILGHSNISETMIYVHISNAMIDTQMTNFGRLLNL